MIRGLLRPTAPGDLAAISDLTDRVFGRRRSLELLDWLLLREEPGLRRQSRVVESEGRVVGHVGVVISRYRWGGAVAEGGHPLLWMVDPEARGDAGMQLGRWCSSHGDLSLVVGGTSLSQPIMKMRRFAVVADAVELRVPLTGRPPAAPEGWTLGELRTVPGDGPPDPAAPVRQIPSAGRLRWLADCPRLETHLGSLLHGGDASGPVLLFVNRRESPATGRVVHLPPADETWETGLDVALDRLAELGCGSASVLTTCPTRREKVARRGGEPFYRRPVYYRNQNDLPERSRWRLDYLEGDLAYRRV